MNDDIGLLVDNYYRNSKVQFNPLPWHDYLCACWKTITKEISVTDLFEESDAIAYAPVNELLNTPFKTFFTDENWARRSEKILGFLRTLLATFNNQTDKIYNVFFNLRELLVQTSQYLSDQVHSFDQFQVEYQYALLIPGGHCFVFDQTFKNSMLPDPKSLRSSGHRLRLCEDVYCFEINAKTRPSAEVFLREFVRQIDPHANLFPSKSLAVLLSKTGPDQFSSQLLQLSLRVPGVELDKLLYAHDAFQFITSIPKKKSSEDDDNNDSAPEKIHTNKYTPEMLVFFIRKLMASPPKESQRTPDVLTSMLAEHYKSRKHCKKVITNLLEEHMLPYELYMVMRVLKNFYETSSLPAKPFASRIKDLIPYVMGLVRFIQEYSKLNSPRELTDAQICDALANVYKTISAYDVQLLALVCHIFLAHDAVGSNFIYTFNETNSLCYIDPDECLVQSPIRLSTEYGVRHFPLINNVLTNFKQFQEVPYNEKLIKKIVRTSADELFIRCLFAAHEYEKTTLPLLNLFEFSLVEKQNLECPLITSSDVMLISFQICKRIFRAIETGETNPQIVLSSALPNTAKIALYAYTTCKNALSTWRTTIFDKSDCFEDIFDECLIAEPDVINIEVTRDESTHEYHLGLKKMCELMALVWIDYKQINDADLKKVTNFAERHLLPDGCVTAADIDSMRERQPNKPNVPKKSRSTSEDFKTPRSFNSETPSTAASSTSTTPRNSKRISEFFKNVLTSATTIEGKRPSPSLRNSGDQNARRPKPHFLSQRSASLNSLPVPHTHTDQDTSDSIPRGASESTVSINLDS